MRRHSVTRAPSGSTRSPPGRIWSGTARVRLLL